MVEGYCLRPVVAVAVDVAAAAASACSSAAACNLAVVLAASCSYWRRSAYWTSKPFRSLLELALRKAPESSRNYFYLYRWDISK